MVAKRFSAMHVREVNLDKRYGDCGKRVPDGHACMGKRRWIDQKKIDAAAGCLVQMVNDGTFVVALKAFHRQPKGLALLHEGLVNLIQGGSAINFWLA
jgi:hypothetical protein